MDKQPGPGQYDESKKESIKFTNLSYSVPQGDRMSPLPRDSVQNPGPGKYHNDINFGKDAPQVSHYF